MSQLASCMSKQGFFRDGNGIWKSSRRKKKLLKILKVSRWCAEHDIDPHVMQKHVVAVQHSACRRPLSSACMGRLAASLLCVSACAACFGVF